MKVDNTGLTHLNSQMPNSMQCMILFFIVEKKTLNSSKFCNLKTKEDYYLWLKLVKKLKIIKGNKKYLVNWRSLENSLSSSKIQRLMDAYKLYHFFENYNSLLSFCFVIRLSFYSIIKKLKIYF